jgi:alpha-D-ribose 1-methylphosphonate 5-triphosphate diphosphatase
MLPALLKLPELAGISLPQAIALASCNPARAAGLHDRGRIEIGLRADLIAISTLNETPRVEGVWCQGKPRIIINGLTEA